MQTALRPTAEQAAIMASGFDPVVPGSGGFDLDAAGRTTMENPLPNVFMREPVPNAVPGQVSVRTPLVATPQPRGLTLPSRTSLPDDGLRLVPRAPMPVQPPMPEVFSYGKGDWANPDIEGYRGAYDEASKYAEDMRSRYDEAAARFAGFAPTRAPEEDMRPAQAAGAVALLAALLGARNAEGVLGGALKSREARRQSRLMAQERADKSALDHLEDLARMAEGRAGKAEAAQQKALAELGRAEGRKGTAGFRADTLEQRGVIAADKELGLNTRARNAQEGLDRRQKVAQQGMMDRAKEAAKARAEEEAKKEKGRMDRHASGVGAANWRFTQGQAGQDRRLDKNIGQRVLDRERKDRSAALKAAKDTEKGARQEFDRLAKAYQAAYDAHEVNKAVVIAKGGEATDAERDAAKKSGKAMSDAKWPALAAKAKYEKAKADTERLAGEVMSGGAQPSEPPGVAQAAPSGPSRSGKRGKRHAPVAVTWSVGPGGATVATGRGSHFGGREDKEDNGETASGYVTGNKSSKTGDWVALMPSTAKGLGVAYGDPVMIRSKRTGKVVKGVYRDYGPAPWTKRVVDMSQGLLGALGSKTDDVFDVWKA